MSESNSTAGRVRRGSVPRLDSPGSLDTEDDDVVGVSSGWSTSCEGRDFNVRCPPRKKARKKPSGPSFYETIFFDRVFTKKRIARARDLWDIDEMTRSSSSVPGNLVPEYIVFHAQLPLSKPKMMGQSKNGPSIQCCVIFKLKKGTRKLLEAVVDGKAQWTNASRLLAAWTKHVRSSVSSKWKGRLKLIMIAQNPDELGLPGMVTRYNGKPVLLTKSTELFVDNPAYVEISTNFAQFCYLFRQAWSSYGIPALKTGDVRVGLVVEGRDDEELPEQILGCVSCHRLGLPEDAAGARR